MKLRKNFKYRWNVNKTVLAVFEGTGGVTRFQGKLFSFFFFLSCSCSFSFSFSFCRTFVGSVRNRNRHFSNRKSSSPGVYPALLEHVHFGIFTRGLEELCGVCML